MRLLEKYKKEVIPAIQNTFGYKNKMAVPHVDKIIVNVGFGRFVTGKTTDEQKKIVEGIGQDLTLITGQKPIVTMAKKSISTFKTREGQAIGAKVTLRRKRMYDFLERLIYIALPRTRDFRGINLDSADEKGNLTIGIREHIVFPEISPEKTKTNFGLEITVVTSAKSKEEGIELLRLLGFPIKK